MRNSSIADEKSSMVSSTQRRMVMKLIGLSLLQPLVACGKIGKSMQKAIGIDVVLYSFLARPIFDIHLNGTDIGVANSYGGTSVVSGVRVPMGVQRLTWRLGGPEGMARNGETVALKNKIVINPSDIPADTHYMGVYLYPDYTAEIAFTEFIPDVSARGQAIYDELDKNERR